MVALLSVVVSLFIPSAFPYAGGPPPGTSGAPGGTTCAQAGCHTGALNTANGNVRIEFPNGTTYTPGVRQRWTITITDVSASVFGFQATARLESNVSAAQAGSFANVSDATAVICDDDAPRPAAGCPARAPIEYIQQTRPNTSRTFTVEWTPPATDAGNVRVFISANAANGNGTNSGDRIYTANYTLTPAAAAAPERPSISSNGVVNALSLAAGVAGQAWTRITGTNFAAEPRTWAPTGTDLPVELGGVSVTVNERPVAVGAVTPTQITALVPTGIGTGEVRVLVRTAAGESTPATVTAAATAPGLLAPFTQEDRRFLLAVAMDGTLVGKTGEGSRAVRPARRGELLTLFGTGFGATTPEAPVNQAIANPLRLAAAPRIRFGETVATLIGTGSLIAPGVYQFQVLVPDSASGDVAVIAEVDSVLSPANFFLSIEP